MSASRITSQDRVAGAESSTPRCARLRAANVEPAAVDDRGFADSAPATHRRAWGTIRRLALLVVLVGVAWRLTRYLLRFPIWGDEAMLLLNYPGKGYLDLAGPLENCQVAPLLFHWAELTALRLFGTSELAVRLPPLLASLGSVVLFWRLARLTQPAPARPFAVAILAVSIWPATLGSLVKPYTFDLFFSLALLTLAVAYRRRPDRLAPLAGLVLLVPVALFASYPAVFVAGAAGVALLPVVSRQERFATGALYLLYNILLVAVFAAHYLIVASAQLGSAVNGATTAAEMSAYWDHGFPPDQPLAFVKWFALAHTGQMAAYPVGAAAGGSILTVLLSLTGAWRLWRRDRWLVALFAGVFGLGLIAAALHGYPYGASCRLTQHLAPVYCLLTGAGLAVLLSHRPRAQIVVLVALALLGVGGIVRDVLRPYRDDESRWARHAVEEMLADAGEDVIVVATPPERLAPVLHWQLVRLGTRIRWGDDFPPDGSSMWLIRSEPNDALPRAGWECVERRPSLLTPSRPREPIRSLVAERWVRSLRP